jgi:uncharacterized surface protein with fasciclin (FAS1) repeats
MRRVFSLAGIILLALAVLLPAAAQDTVGAAQVRVAYFVKDAASVDVYVNGSLMREGLHATEVGAYMLMDAGTHTVALQHEGADVIVPVDVVAEAGHHYTLAVIGQVDDAMFATLLVDETSAYADYDPLSSNHIIIHNLAGAPPLDVYYDGVLAIDDLAYGEYATTTQPPANHDLGVRITLGDDPNIVLLPDGPGFWEPSVSWFVALVGTYPGALGPDWYPAFGTYTPLNSVEFVASFNGRGITFTREMIENGGGGFLPQAFNFDTLLAALEIAGLTELLSGEGPYTLFAPTDEAFAALPQSTLDRLMADPVALRNLLLYHVAEGVVGSGHLPAGESLTLTTLHGGSLTMSNIAEQAGQEIFALNEDAAGCGCAYQTTNGTVFVIDHVLMPPVERRLGHGARGRYVPEE